MKIFNSKGTALGSIRLKGDMVLMTGEIVKQSFSRITTFKGAELTPLDGKKFMLEVAAQLWQSTRMFITLEEGEEWLKS